MVPRMGKLQRCSVRDGQAIVKWTRSRGFEMCSPLAHAESVQHLLAIVGDSLDHPTFRLQQLEYRDKQMFLIKEQRLLQALHHTPEQNAADQEACRRLVAEGYGSDDAFLTWLYGQK